MKPTDAQIIEEQRRQQAVRNVRNGSKDFYALNPLTKNTHGTGVASPKVAAPVTPGGSGGKASGVRQRKCPNKTETAFLALLEARRKRGEFTRVDREGITLRWPDGMTYTPDAVCWNEVGAPLLIETKGAFIRRSGLEKFRAARAQWSWFSFELWQRVKGEWKKLL